MEPMHALAVRAFGVGLRGVEAVEHQHAQESFLVRSTVCVKLEKPGGDALF